MTGESLLSTLGGPGFRPYRGLLALSFLSRLPLGMAAVGLLTIALSRGLGPGVGGTAVATYALSFALAGPLLGRRAERSGPRRVLTECLVGQMLACALLLAHAGGTWALIAAAAILGLTTPPLAAIMRATWNRLLADDVAASERLAVAETMNTEGSHIFGRTIVAILSIIGAIAIPLVYAALMAYGLLRLRTDPRIVPPPTPARGRGGEPMANRTTLIWGAVMLVMAVSHGAAATAIVTTAGPIGGWQGPFTMALWGVGSLLGGVLVLRRGDLAGPARTVLLGAVLFVACALAAWQLSGARLWVLLALVVALGLPISPMVSAVFRGTRPAAPASRQVELFAVYTSLSFLGFSIGSAAAGWAAELSGSQSLGFLVAAAAAAISVPPLAALRTRPSMHEADSTA